MEFSVVVVSVSLPCLFHISVVGSASIHVETPGILRRHYHVPTFTFEVKFKLEYKSRLKSLTEFEFIVNGEY